MDINDNITQDSMIGRRVGVYELQKEIGRGGMGAVYLAGRADGEFHQTVAVKLIKRGMDTDQILKRFRRERQILARLNHPNIAYFFGGGSTGDGLPYFVMEYIKGVSLYRFCDENKLNTDERLQIFRQICDAVDAAHQIKVIHRDLKPSNILVKADGKPKLLDFGIAKVLDPEFETAESEPTATHLRVMTPEYASPEQLRGDEITPASDVYSLGVILYELLTGHRPYRLKKRATYEVARIICEEIPSRPSGSVTSEDNLVPVFENEKDEKDERDDKDEKKISLGSVYAARKTSPTTLRNELSGDLDRIILKTLRKNPKERYQTAAELAEDITNYLEKLPVKAENFITLSPAPVSNAERNEKENENNKQNDKHSVAILPFRMFGAARTNDTGENSDEFLSVGLADALVTRLSGVQRLVVRPTSSVLRFGQAADSFSSGRELGVDFVVEGNIRRVGQRIRITAQLLNMRDNSTRWSESFDELFTDVLELEDSISEKVAQSLIPQLTGEERRQLEKRGTNSPEAYEAFLRGRFYWSLQSEEGFARAIQFYRRAVELDPNYALAYAAMTEYYIFLGIHCVIPFAEGAKAAKEMVERSLFLDPTLAEAHALLGFVEISYNWDWEAAEKHLRRAIELNPNSVTAHNWLNSVLLQRGLFSDALDEIDRILELDPDSILSLHLQAWAFYHSRRFAESIRVHQKMLRVEPNYAWGLQTFSWVLRRVGQYDEAIAKAGKAVALTGENHFYLSELAAVYAEAGEREKAEKILARLAEIAETRFVSDYMLALTYCALGDKDEAFAHLEKSLAARDGWFNWLGVDPQVDVLRGDARYDDLMRRAGNPLAKTTGDDEKSSEKICEESSEKSGEKSGEKISEKSIAVLPLKLFGSPTGSNDEYLGIGLADALVTRLSNVRQLVVRPTSSVLPFNESGVNPFMAGRELDVDYVLDGNIRRAGDRIRVTVQLLNVGDKSSRWAEIFNEKFTDVLELEDSISEKVVKSLIPTLTGEERNRFERRSCSSPEAYEAYLRGRFHWNQFTPDALVKAFEAFQAAIKIDPDYALAHVGLADSYIWANIYGMIPSAEAVPLAEKAALRAIELDDKLGEAYASLGLTNQNRFSWEKALKLYEKALKLAPNYVHAHEWLAAQLVGHGDFEAGAKEMKIAERLDPLSLRTKTLTAWTLYQARFYDEALERGRQIIYLDANYPQGYAQTGLNLLAMKRVEESLSYFRKFDAMIPDSVLAKYQLCFALAAAGRETEARKILKDVETLHAKGYVKPYFLAMTYAALDERDAALENFEKAYAEDDPWMLWFGTEPLLENMRGDRRYNDILRRMNNPLAKP